MKAVFRSLAVLFATCALLHGQVSIDEAAFGKSMGGWTKRGKKAAEYELSGSTYRTYRPEVSLTPDGGLFVSLRIDNMRGWMASDDHATLEVTVSKQGLITSARSNIAIQGRTITSDLIRGGNETAKQLVGMDRAVQIGTDLVADLSAKLLREKIVEAGRVSFPAAVRHNYNLLYQSIVKPEASAAPSPDAKPAEDNAKVKIESYKGPVVEGLPGE